MRFEIIGTGAMGLLFSVRLKAAGYSVKLWASSLETANLLAQEGVTYFTLEGQLERLHDFDSDVLSRSLYGNEHIKNRVTAQRAAQHNESSSAYILLAVKQAHLTDEFLAELGQLISSNKQYCAVLALQNGCGHIEKLSQYIHIPIITAVTREASKRLDVASIAHTGKGETWIGDELGRDIDGLQQKNIEKALQKAGFKAFMSKNIKEQVYRKLISNAVINPLTALFDVNNGELPASKQRHKLMEALFEEGKFILSAEEPSLMNVSFEEILQLCRATAANTSSMRADLLKGVETEVAYINGAISAIAARLGMRAPLNQSIVHMIEALHPDQ